MKKLFRTYLPTVYVISELLDARWRLLFYKLSFLSLYVRGHHQGDGETTRVDGPGVSRFALIFFLRWCIFQFKPFRE